MSEKVKNTNDIYGSRFSGIKKRLLVSDVDSIRNLNDKLENEQIIISDLSEWPQISSDITLDILLLSEKYYLDNIDKIKEVLSEIELKNSLIYLLGNNLNNNNFEHIDSFIPEPINEQYFFKSLKSGYKLLQNSFENEYLLSELKTRDTQLQELSHIGMQLMTEKDGDKLLNLILEKSRELTGADAGSLYLVEDDGKKKKQLRFILTQNDSASFEFQEFTMPISRASLSGFVADTGQMLNLPDVYNLPEDSEFSFNKSFDQKIGYQTRSMLVVPLINHIDEIIGVIQLINRKRDWTKKLTQPDDFENEIIPFSGSCIEMVNALAGHAAISIENNSLYLSIERLFEGFVKASVTAIESRDPTTSGHSERVAGLTVKLAETVDKIQTGPYSDEKFTLDQIKEIRYASLLHDFGKVGVRENVLLKEKKLFPAQLNDIRYRLGFLKKNQEIESLKKHIDFLLKNGQTGYKYKYIELKSEMEKKLDDLDKLQQFIEEINEPTVLTSDNSQRLKELATVMIIDENGEERNLLRDDEVLALSIGRGSLSEKERFEIESHVTHTYNFLALVPWTTDIKNIPEIAYKHHEKLNGAGYPNNLKTEDIPIQSKMMSISDIFDALTASDRPYKRAVPYEKALDILGYEVKDKHLNKDLLDIFIEAEVYRVSLK